MTNFREYFKQQNDESVLRVIVESNDLLVQISEGKTVEFGHYKARKDSPHFQGGEYHGHCELPGGGEVSWTVTGKRLHPNKFPAKFPQGAKDAVAKALGVSPEIFESYHAYDEIEGKDVFILVQKEAPGSQLKRLLEGLL